MLRSLSSHQISTIKNIFLRPSHFLIMGWSFSFFFNFLKHWTMEIFSLLILFNLRVLKTSPATSEICSFNNSICWCHQIMNWIGQSQFLSEQITKHVSIVFEVYRTHCLASRIFVLISAAKLKHYQLHNGIFYFDVGITSHNKLFSLFLLGDENDPVRQLTLFCCILPQSYLHPLPPHVVLFGLPAWN